MADARALGDEPTTLRLLLVEDSEDDARLLLHTLRRGGYSVVCRRVESADEMREALAEPWHIVISDFSIPRFGGMAALRLLRESGLDLPFVIVSGTIGEDTAVEALKAGADDFMVKGRLARLIPVVERELREAASRRHRRQAEEALRESEARHRMLFESSPIPILISEERTARIIAANPAAVRTYGYSEAELTSMTMSALEAQPGRSDTPGESNAALARHRLKNKSVIDVDVIRYPLELNSGRACVSFVNDVTDKRRVDDQLRQSQKLEALGRLAGGIAHDFNNMLTPILSYSTLLERDLKEADPVRQDLIEIRQAGERAHALVQQLMAFSRQRVLQPQALDLNASVAAMEKMLRRVIGEHVEFVTTFERGVETILIDPTEIEQIIMNLVLNARDAMPNGGRLSIETRNVRLDLEQVRGATLPPGRYVELTVSDTGAGMDSATKARIFEPFFTTKPSGKGTGLGLATVHAIVTKNSGLIQVVTKLGEGTTFRVHFPRHGARASVSGQHVMSFEQRCAETVLVVEDDDLVRRSVRAILRRSGYTVLEARSGGDALVVAERHAGGVHVLVTDVVMPNMGGRELAERLMATRPNLKVLFMSGYTSDEALRQEILDAEVPFIQKPFTPDALARKIREILDQE